MQLEGRAAVYLPVEISLEGENVYFFPLGHNLETQGICCPPLHHLMVSLLVFASRVGGCEVGGGGD